MRDNLIISIEASEIDALHDDLRQANNAAHFWRSKHESCAKAFSLALLVIAFLLASTAVLLIWR